MQERKELPIGIQTFAKIRDPKENFVYIDKTEMAYKLTRKTGYYFLSRPRRFGKSLFLDTLSELFKGSKGLFEGLYIYDKWNWDEKYPVIKINLGYGNFSTEEKLPEVIRTILKQNCEQLGIDTALCEHSDLGFFLERVIHHTHKKYSQNVVVLIDEYDKPILDNIHKDDKTVAIAAQKTLHSFYSAIKASDPYLRFVLLTGVSKFSKLNLFSGLNNLDDITLDERYSTITGYTQKELEESFSEHIEETNIEELKRWYNGYNYLGEPVYNPFDILLFFAKNKRFNNYWWETGNPSFLIQKLKEQPQFVPDFETKLVTKETLDAFDIEHIDLTALLWQTGYLTFDKKLGDESDVFYKMKVPNLEVQRSMNHLFFNYLSNIQHQTSTLAYTAKIALVETDMEKLKQALTSVFSAISHHNYTNNPMANYEGYYASIVFTFLSSLSYSVIAEDTTNHGRIDMTMVGHDSIFILEFKVDMPSEDALHQIKTKRYYEKYLHQSKPIYLIGIQFDSELRNISEFKHERLDPTA